MKKLLLSLAICFGLVSFASELSAQSTAIAPYDGATHTYTFDGITDGLDYEFYVSTNPNGIVQAGLITDYGILVGDAPVDGILGGVVSGGEVSVDITWDLTAAAKYGAAGSVQTGVYLFVRVFDTSDATVCENFKSVMITPTTNAFNVTLADAGTSPSCPDLINGFNPLESSYNSGKTTLTFEIDRSGSTNNWTFDFDITQVGTGAFTYSIEGGLAVAGTTGGTINVPVNNYTVANATIVIVVDNVTNESPVFTLEVKNAADDVTSVIPVAMPASVGHTISTMPAIGSFTGS
tara:strand:- start:11763 stop:12638 length:876 start_codon:yes stop_codon:yes gene_type:complete